MYKSLLTVAIIFASGSAFAVSAKEMIKTCKEECKEDFKGKGEKAAHKCADMKNGDGTAKYPKCAEAHKAHEAGDDHGHGGDSHKDDGHKKH